MRAGLVGCLPLLSLSLSHRAPCCAMPMLPSRVFNRPTRTASDALSAAHVTITAIQASTAHLVMSHRNLTAVDSFPRCVRASWDAPPLPLPLPLSPRAMPILTLRVFNRPTRRSARTISDAIAAAQVTLTAIQASTDLFVPLKTAVSIAILSHP
ncbi:hypothetical protein B0H11DRAFT_1937385 [Mycena galericulata]|nr:hypothetical protein B0H11DRAFT_1937385 [Mycena galericulata]